MPHNTFKASEYEGFFMVTEQNTMKQSAGILLYKKTAGQLQFLLVHPGGPFWKHKDLGSWSIPKGMFTDEEKALDAAIREFEEETGLRLHGNFTQLNPVKLKSGKVVYAFALKQSIVVDAVASNTFEMEWPPRSGVMRQFPEIDKVAWFTAEEALEKINPAQGDFIVQLLSLQNPNYARNKLSTMRFEAASQKSSPE